jgi:hypothetical protein
VIEPAIDHEISAKAFGAKYGCREVPEFAGNSELLQRVRNRERLIVLRAAIYIQLDIIKT